MGDLAEVEVEDVAPVLPRRGAEVHVAAHPAGPDERRVQPLERHVAGADEVDLLLARPRRAKAQLDLADLTRDDVQRVEERVDAVGQEALGGGRVVDAVHDDEQLVEREAAAHAAHAGDHEAPDRVREPQTGAGTRAPAARRAGGTAARARPRSRARCRRRGSARRRARRRGGRGSSPGVAAGSRSRAPGGACRRRRSRR